jgi:hypothetical protein
VGVAPPGFEVRRSMSRVAFRVFPAGRAGDTRWLCRLCNLMLRVCICEEVMEANILISNSKRNMPTSSSY